MSSSTTNSAADDLKAKVEELTEANKKLREDEKKHKALMEHQTKIIAQLVKTLDDKDLAHILDSPPNSIALKLA